MVFGFAPVPLKLSGEQGGGGFSSNYVYVNNLQTPPMSCSLLTLQQALDPTSPCGSRAGSLHHPQGKHMPGHALHLIMYVALRWVLEHVVVSASRERAALASSCSSSTSCLIPLVPVLFEDLYRIIEFYKFYVPACLAPLHLFAASSPGSLHHF